MVNHATDSNIVSGTRLDELVIAYRIARGMNTDVLAVWHTCLCVPLICKLLRIDEFDLQDSYHARRVHKWRRLLRAEAAALKRFNHPNIVRLIADCTNAVMPYLLLEYVTGKTLRDRLREEKQLAIDEAVRIVQHTGAALMHVHEKGFIHRDLKPSNIILRDTRPVLLDFGVVWRWRTRNGNARRPPDRCGTPQYLSPEQIRREPLSPLTDIYGLGVLLFELIAGARPFPASKRTHEHTLPLAVRYPQLETAPSDLRELRPDVSAKLVAVIKRAMHREASRRFQSVAEMLIALDAFTDIKIYPRGSSRLKITARDAFIQSTGK